MTRTEEKLGTDFRVVGTDGKAGAVFTDPVTALRYMRGYNGRAGDQLVNFETGVVLARRVGRNGRPARFQLDATG